MKTARFHATTWVDFEGVPIPDHLTGSKEILEYLMENINDFTKYQISLDCNSNESIYQAILEDEDGNETTITLDD